MNALKRLSVAAALFAMAAGAAAQTTIAAGESAALSLPLWHTLTMTGSGATCIQTRLSDTPGNGQSQGTHSVSSSDTVVVGPYATVTRHEIRCSVGSLSYVLAPASFVVTGGIIASDIDASDVPADEECLTYEGTGPALEWQTCGGGLADGDYGDVAVSASGTVMMVESGTATTAGALAANGANCSAGSYPLGVDASGAAESCTVAGTGDVVGPASSTDNAIARFDSTTGKLLQESAVTVADTTGAISGAQSITGGTSGTSTLTLDGDSGVAGAVTVGSAGSLAIPETSSGTYGYKFDGLSDAGLQSYNAGNVALGSSAGKFLVFRNGSTGLALFDVTGFVMLSGAQYKWDTFGGTGDTGLARVSAGVVRASDGGVGIRGFLGGGAAVASATALPVPTGRVFHVTGTTTITSITSTNLQSGVCVTLIFDDALTFTDGSNLKLNGDFVTTADDTWHGCYDGTNWYEEGRSAN